MEHSSAFTPTVFERWRRRENLLPGIALVALAASGWVYVAYQANSMAGMEMGNVVEFVPFLSGWVAMMVAMMLPATLPLILLYRAVARGRSSPVQVRIGMAVLLLGYVLIWTVAGLPVYVYDLVAQKMSLNMAVLPGALLIVGGLYQFTDLKGRCHARCSSPLFFLMQNWKEGMAGTLRLGALHGIDCLGCCLGLMVGLVALGMMNLAWMLTAALIIFAEKTLPGSHRIALPLGILMVAGGVASLGFSVLSGMESM